MVSILTIINENVKIWIISLILKIALMITIGISCKMYSFCLNTCYINVRPCWCLNLHKYCISLTLARIFRLLHFYIQRVDCRYWSMKQIAMGQVIKLYSQYYSAWNIYMEMVTKQRRFVIKLINLRLGQSLKYFYRFLPLHNVYTVYKEIFTPPPSCFFFAFVVSGQI